MTVVPSATSKPVVTPDGERVVSWPALGPSDAIAARVAEVGSGDPVVFLHGLVGLNDHWEAVVDLVKPRARCIRFELPLLELPGDHCSIEGVAQITRRFLLEHVGRPAVLVGNSFGGHVALRLAMEHPEVVRGLVLAGSSGLFERTLDKDIQLRPSREWIGRKLAELFFDKNNVWESDIDRAYTELNTRHCARAMVKLSKSAKGDHLGDRLHRVTQPTLLLWGRNDVVTPPDTAEEFHQLIPGSRLVWIDRCGHAPMMEHPDRFAGEMLSFLNELGLATPTA